MPKFETEREGQSFQLQFPNDSVGFDPEAFDELLRNQGVQMVHWRSMACPVGKIDPDDVRRPHDHHENCSNSFIYTEAGTITVGFLGNSKDSRFTDPGRVDGSTVNVVLPRAYDTGNEVEITPFDRFYLSEEVITVPTWQSFAAHRTGIDRLLFPVVSVTDLIDSHGNRYEEGVDFEVKKGQLHWGQRRPGVDPASGKGVVCSIRYRYRPHWYVKNLVHEIRVAQTEDEFGNRSVQRFPQQAVLQREIQFQKEALDPQAPDAEGRQKPAPVDGSFGSR